MRIFIFGLWILLLGLAGCPKKTKEPLQIMRDMKVPERRQPRPFKGAVPTQGELQQLQLEKRLQADHYRQEKLGRVPIIQVGRLYQLRQLLQGLAEKMTTATLPQFLQAAQLAFTKIGYPFALVIPKKNILQLDQSDIIRVSWAFISDALGEEYYLPIPTHYHSCAPVEGQGFQPVPVLAIADDSVVVMASGQKEVRLVAKNYGQAAIHQGGRSAPYLVPLPWEGFVPDGISSDGKHLLIRIDLLNGVKNPWQQQGLPGEFIFVLLKVGQGVLQISQDLDDYKNLPAKKPEVDKEGYYVFGQYRLMVDMCKLEQGSNQ